jgi:hypothetical protein
MPAALAARVAPPQPLERLPLLAAARPRLRQVKLRLASAHPRGLLQAHQQVPRARGVQQRRQLRELPPLQVRVVRPRKLEHRARR